MSEVAEMRHTMRYGAFVLEMRISMYLTHEERLARRLAMLTINFHRTMYWRTLGFNVTPSPNIVDFLIDYNILQEDYDMARGKSNRSKKNDDWKGFISGQMTVEEKASFREYKMSDAEVAKGIFNLNDDGYKLSCGYDKNNDSVFASITNRGGHADYVGFSLSAHAKSPEIALRLLLFKHYVIAEGDWSFWDMEDADDFG